MEDKEAKINCCYRKDYRKYLSASVLDSANNKIASSAFLTAFAVYLGLSNLSIAIFSVLNIITNIFQIFAAPLFYKIGQSKKVVLGNYSIYRIASVCFAIIPFCGTDIGLRTALFFIFATIYSITGEMGYVTFVNWRMSLINKEDRAKFSSTKNIFSNIVIIATSLSVGVILDHFTAVGQELTGFLIMFALIFVIAFTDILIRVKTYKPELENKKVTLKETISIPAKDKNFRKIVAICALKCFAESIGLIYINIFLLKELKVDYLYYSILNLIIPLSSALFSKMWAKIAQKRIWVKVLLPMSVLYLSAFLLLFLLPNTPLFYVMPVIFIIIGCASSAYNIFDNIAIYESAKDGYHTSYITFERFIEGIAVSVIPLITAFVSEESKLGIKITFILGLSIFLLLFILLIIFYKTGRKPKFDKNDEIDEEKKEDVLKSSED